MKPVSLDSLKEQVSRIPIDKIKESVITLRTEYEGEALEELGESLVDQGQLQTIVVQPADDGFYELVIGSRRLRAARHKKMRDIAAFVIEKRSTIELLFIALAENLHRRDLNPFEEAQGFLRLMKEFELPLDEVAKGVNKPDAYVRSRLQLLSMPEAVIKMVSEKSLSLNSVRTLARLPTGEAQTRLAQLAATHHLTQSELSVQVRKELSEPARIPRQSHELTSLKLGMRIESFVTFLQKVPRRMKLYRINAVERQNVLKLLETLENQTRLLRDTVKGPSMAVSEQSSSAEPANYGQEWTVQEIKKINSPNRPSDDVLAVQLGRTVTSIRSMRSKTG